MGYSVAIDGPAGAGKSTIAKQIARKLDFIYVDTGAMYRAMAYYLLQNHVDASDTAAIDVKCREADIRIRYENKEQQVWLNGENVNGMIRTEEVGNMASASSVNPNVRAKLVELQRKMAETDNVIMDGRDIGTTVLPNADVKIYLTAGSHVRARRRYEELKEKGLWFVCADMGGQEMYKLNLKGPIGLVIGNEGEGVSRLVREKCDMIASIPMKGDIDSLNASVAAGVLAYEIVRQRMM